MFGGKKSEPEVTSVETIIGKNTVFKGTVTTQGSVRIDGKFEGELISSGNVVVGNAGVVHARINAKNLTVAGEVYGDMNIDGKLELLTSSKLYGDIQVNILTIEEGAVFKGASEMRKSESKDSATTASSGTTAAATKI